MRDLQSVLLVFFGGGAGAALRFALNRIGAEVWWLQSFPWITLTINVSGSFLLGVFAGLFQSRPNWLLLLGTGLCGGFTTFSTFSVEALTLLEQQRFVLAACYLLGSVLAGVLGAWLGSVLMR